MDKYDAYEQFEGYEQLVGPQSRQERRGHKPKRIRKNDKKLQTINKQIREMDDGIKEWVPSYAASLDPLHHERHWVITSVSPFYRDQMITDLTRLVKGGKEANVYVCTGHPATGHELIAAKLYRPRELRHLKNDAVYKAGRMLRGEDGKQLKGRRVKLALRKKTSFGKKLDIMWWINNEFRTQQLLYESGADVPEPFGHQGNTILMEYIGDANGPAPTLSEINLPPKEARPLFQRIMDNVALMLDNHFVHGDLSAYNILYWEGEITIIDFPQLVEARTNPHAFELLQRDITRVCDYFRKYGVETDPQQLTLDLWEPYMGRDY